MSRSAEGENKERLSISFPAESEAHASVALAELVQL